MPTGIDTYSQVSNPYGQQGSFEEGVRLVKKRKLQEGINTKDYVSRLKKVMAALEGMCTMCMVQNPGNQTQHNYMANYCPGLDFSHFLTWKVNVRYKINVHGPLCTICHLSQIDDTLHKRISPGRRAISKCPYPDRILPLVFAIYHHTATHEAAQAQFRVQWHTDTEYAFWLCGPPECINKTNTMKIILWFMETCL